MKAIALVASFAIHYGALSAIPDAHESTASSDIAKSVQTSDDACKCDLEVTADCSAVTESGESL
jgi:hypothetical protein